jgi:hypothetical protein
MEARDIRNLQEAYLEVYDEGFKRYDSDKFSKQMDNLRSSGKKDQATENIKKIKIGINAIISKCVLC